MPDARSAPRPLKDAGSRTRLPREVLALGVIAFFVMVGFGVVVPVLPIYVRSFGVGNVEVGAVISAFALMRLVASPFCGRLIDWGGERTILALGIGIVAVSSGLAGVAQSYLQLLLLRGAGGIGSAMFTVSAMTLLLGSTSPAIPARAIGFYQGGFLIGGMAGPALGGLLATISLTAPFFFYAATLAIAGVVGLALLRPGARVAPADASTPRLPLATVLRDPRFRAACAANFSQGWTSFGVRNALIPVLIVEVLKGPSSFTGIAFACAAVAQTLALAPAARFIDTIGRKPAIIGSFALAAVTIMAVPFAPNFWVLTALLCLYGWRPRSWVPRRRRLSGTSPDRAEAARWRCSRCSPISAPSSAPSSPGSSPTPCPSPSPSPSVRCSSCSHRSTPCECPLCPLAR
jgi:DHA1 family multidrug resistance protein-like MFS transporter